LIGVIFGPPGSGKGTQAARLQSKFGLDHVSTGDMLRAEIARGTPTGRRVKAIIAAGDLVPDTLILDLVRVRLATEGGRDFLLDGFPRTVEQARALAALLSPSGRQVDFVVALEVPEEALIQRLLGRARKEGRPDDKRAAILERMREYRAQTAPVLAFYQDANGYVTSVSGVGTPDEVFARVRKAVPVRA
jgi:adenylate kinase